MAAVNDAAVAAAAASSVLAAEDVAAQRSLLAHAVRLAAAARAAAAAGGGGGGGGGEEAACVMGMTAGGLTVWPGASPSMAAGLSTSAAVPALAAAIAAGANALPRPAGALVRFTTAPPAPAADGAEVAGGGAAALAAAVATPAALPPPVVAGIEHAGWLCVGRSGRMASDAARDAAGRALGFPPPEILFDANCVHLHHARSGLSFWFSLLPCLDAVSPAGGAVRVAGADAWSASRGGGFRLHETGRDWAFTTAYAGTLARCGDGGAAAAAAEPVLVTPAPPDGGIDYEALQRRDEILWYYAGDLFEDELHDNGVSSYNVRVRVMPDRWLALGRSFVRVDGVVLRVRDTRIAHVFGQPHVVRERSVREATFAELGAAGRPTEPAAYRDPAVAVDALPVVSCVTEHIALR